MASIKTRATVITIIPLVGMLAVAAYSFSDRYFVAERMAHAEELAHLSIRVSDLVQELQRERGAAAIYLASGGMSFAMEQMDQWQATDKAVATFRAAVAGAGAETAGQLGDPLGALAPLAEWRAQTERQDLGATKSYRNYTTVIAGYLDLMARLGRAATSSETATLQAAYEALVKAKERAAREVALGAGIISKRAFESESYQQFVAAGAAEGTFLAEFVSLTDTAELRRHQEALRAATTAEQTGSAADMRAQLLALPNTRDVGALMADLWYEAGAKRTDALKTVEDTVAGAFASRAAQLGEQAWHSFLMLGVGVAVLTLLTAAVSTWLVRGIVGPLGAVVASTVRLSRGETVPIPSTERKDEIGEVARAVAVFHQVQEDARRLREDQERQRADLADEQRRQLVALADDLDSKVSSAVALVVNGAGQISETANTLGGKVDDSTSRSFDMAGIADRSAASVQTVAAAAEELAASIEEIGRQVTHSTSIAADAVSEAERLNQRITGLTDAASNIGEVVNLITDIASQTNLLALNATIEAARAGEAGKGFAVVANEVKSLANQTATATESISGQIVSIQQATQAAAEGIRAIDRTIRGISEIATAIASAVEEQGAATQEIARNVRSVSADSQCVRENVQEVSQSSAWAYGSAIQVLWAADDLAAPAERLRSEFDTFLASLRTA